MPIEYVLSKSVPSAIQSIEIIDNALIIKVKEKQLLFICKFIKYSSLLNFKMLLDIWAYDTLKANEKRFIINYMLAAPTKNQRLYIKSNPTIHNGIFKLPSITSLYNSAGYLEREVWDLIGIFFNSHPDLRRIVTDYGFNGFPLRKDYPVTGFKELRYDDKLASLVYEPVKFSQAYRSYTYENPWKPKEFK